MVTPPGRCLFKRRKTDCICPPNPDLQMRSSECSPLAPWCSSHSSPGDRPNERRKAVRNDETAGAATGRPAVHETGVLVVLGKHDRARSCAKAIVDRTLAARCQMHAAGLREDAEAK